MRRIAHALLAAVLTAACRDAPAPEETPGVAAGGTAAVAGADRSWTGGLAGEPSMLPSAVRVVEGTIASATADTITVRPRSGNGTGETLTLRLDPQAGITVDGRPATADELEEGAPVRAAYTFETGVPRAVRVAVGVGSAER